MIMQMNPATSIPNKNASIVSQTPFSDSGTVENGLSAFGCAHLSFIATINHNTINQSFYSVESGDQHIMAERYNPQEIEKKWQQKWAEDRLYEAKEDGSKPKWYALTMFPYTSGDLHIGHWYAMAPSDVHARFKRMQGFNVLHPIGFDSFGLPAENAAIKRGIHPFTWTMKNIENMRRQLKTMGAIHDWSREVITCLARIL